LALERTRGVPYLLPLLALAGPLTAGDIDPQSRIDGLEARLEGLTRRVQALESLLRESGSAATTAPSVKSQPIWEPDEYCDGDPFRIIQTNLDRESGRVDLLLEVVAPIPDRAAWESVPRGDTVPLTLSASEADGGPASEISLRLERATRFDPGARLHLSAQLGPEVAQRARTIRITHEPSPAAGAEAGP
jgi:hypothetical protein